jgi:hypothetical protein
MTTKKRINSYIARAQEMGSSAKTLKGAGKYIVANAEAHHGLQYIDRISSGDAEPAWGFPKLRINRPRGHRADYIDQQWRKRVDARKRLPKAAEARAREIVNRANAQRARQRLEATGASAIKRMWDLDAIASNLEYDWPFRQSQSSWAGGEHSVSVSLGASPYANGHSEKVWSDNDKWSGTNSFAHLTVTPSALIWFPDLRTPDGSIILDAKRTGPREFEVAWVRQSRGVELAVEHGYLIRGFHCKAASLKAARKKAAAARRAQLESAIRIRANRKGYRDFRTIFIDMADSLQAGNCAEISKQFANQVWRSIDASGPCAVRADVVLRMRDDIYTRRALSAANTRV